jgi:hypothetical protein
MSTEQLIAKMGAEQFPPDTFVWWKGQRDWIPIDFWREHMQDILESVASQTQKAMWKIYFGSKEIGPLTRTELIQNLKLLPDLSKVYILSEGMAQKKPVFEMHDVMELMGIDRREFERTPLRGEVRCTRTKRSPRTFNLKAAGLSIGGIGVTGDHDFERGDELTLHVSSPDMGGKIQVQGEVVYVTNTGFAGIRFQKVTAEAGIFIHDYVKQFDIRPKNKAAA